MIISFKLDKKGCGDKGGAGAGGDVEGKIESGSTGESGGEEDSEGGGESVGAKESDDTGESGDEEESGSEGEDWGEVGRNSSEVSDIMFSWEKAGESIKTHSKNIKTE